MRYSGTNADSIGVPKNFDKTKGVGGLTKLTGLFICKVIDITDDRYEGFMNVEIIGQGYQGETVSVEERKKYARVRRAMPYGGQYQFEGYTSSYGMSTHPPAPGSEVLVAFANNSSVGIVIGVLPDVTRNASVPTAPGAFVDSEDNTVGPTYDPSVQREQKGSNKRPRARQEGIARESSEYKDQVNKSDGVTGQGHESVATQGIGLDSIRGLSSSSQRRESPTQVFGFNTPGGHQFVMDDGTKSKSETCLAPDANRKEGLSNLVRWRSAGGAQILMHDGAGIVYVVNHNGSSWIQMDATGKVDIYSADSISMHTQTDFNLYCEGSFNLDADTINLKARGSGGTTIESATGEFNLHANKDIKLTSDLNGHIKTAGFIRQTSAIIDLNGPEATAATKTVANNIAVNTTVKESINGRVPEAEPWGGHQDQVEDAKTLPQVASATTEFIAQDIDMTKINKGPKETAGTATTTPVQNPRALGRMGPT